MATKKGLLTPIPFFTDAAKAGATTVWTDTTSTFYPDANPETSTVDGRIRNSPAGGNAVWSTIHDAADGTTAYDSDTQAGAAMIFAGTSSNGWSDIFRGFFLFDTSSIPDADDVSAPELYLFVYTDGLNDNATLDQKINVSDSNPSSNTSLSTADYDTITNITTRT